MENDYNYLRSSERYNLERSDSRNENNNNYTFLPQTNLTDTSLNQVVLDIDSVENYKKYAAEIERTYTVGSMTYHAMTLDLVAIYLKGQKNLYIESKTYCEVFLYSLMLPAIFISTLCTVLNVPLKDNGIAVSALNGFNSFLLSVITYLKLDAKAEAHKISAYQFDKLQTNCEFYSGRILMVQDDDIKNSVNHFIENLEKKVAEIKDANQFIIPQSIRYRYNDIYSYNVFLILKQYKTKRILNVQKLLDVIAEINWRKKQFGKDILLDDIVSHNILDDFAKPNNNSGIIRLILGFKKKEDDELEIMDEVYRKKNIYDVYTTLSDLYKIREICIKDIIKYRNFSSDLNMNFNEQLENHILKTKNNFHRYVYNLDILRT